MTTQLIRAELPFDNLLQNFSLFFFSLKTSFNNNHLSRRMLKQHSLILVVVALVRLDALGAADRVRVSLGRVVHRLLPRNITVIPCTRDTSLESM